MLSGDTGFYSGAKKLAELLKARPGKYDIRLIPGVSSVACLAAKLGTSWEDAAVISLHGQDENFIQTVNRNHKTFLLSGRGRHRRPDAAAASGVRDGGCDRLDRTEHDRS